MASFNLDDYEPVEARLEKFHKEFKDGRVITDMVEYGNERVVFKAYLFRTFEEEKPWATGFAEETRGQGGPVNATSLLENCETSAIGRALANAGYAPKGKRPSREEMQKVERLTPKSDNEEKKEETIDTVCPKCGGKLIRRTTKTGKKYIQCENRRYDYVRKVEQGSCDYAIWE